MSEQKWLAVAAVLCLSLNPTDTWSADVRDFYVRNDHASSVMTGLEVSNDGVKWNTINLGDGIKYPDQKKIVWNKTFSTTLQCKLQFRAAFTNGEVSNPVSVNLCNAATQRISFGKPRSKVGDAQ